MQGCEPHLRAVGQIRGLRLVCPPSQTLRPVDGPVNGGGGCHQQSSDGIHTIFFETEAWWNRQCLLFVQTTARLYGLCYQSLHGRPPPADRHPLSCLAQLAPRTVAAALATVHQRYPGPRQAVLSGLWPLDDFAQSEVWPGSRERDLGLQQFSAVLPQAGLGYGDAPHEPVALQRMNEPFEKGQHWITPQRNYT